MCDERERENQQRLKMAAAVSCDLRDQAAVILAAKDSLQRVIGEYMQDPGQQKAAAALQYIEQSVHRLERINMNLQDSSRCAAGQLIPAWQPVCLSEACRQLCEQAALFAQGQNLRCRLPKKAVIVPSDPYFFDRILLNLLTNAMQACPEGNITVTLKSDAGWVLVAVDDQGPGLPPQRLAAPFEPVYRSQTSCGQLGLYVSHLLAEQLGGSLQAENLPAGGARLVLRLPVRDELGQQAFFAPDAMQEQYRQKRMRAEFSVLVQG